MKPKTKTHTFWCVKESNVNKANELFDKLLKKKFTITTKVK